MSYPATVGNLSQFVGEAKTFQDSIVDADGAAQDITSWTAILAVYAYNDPDIVFFTLTGVITGAATLGIFTFTNDPANTSGMKPGQYSFSVERTDGSGSPPANAAVPTIGLFTLLSGSTGYIDN